MTDYEWFRELAGTPGIEEVNFWQPGGNRPFRLLSEGELFLFKLHSPRNYIVGGGILAHTTIIQVSQAWESFQEKNGAHSLEEMRSRIEKYRRTAPAPSEDYSIGSIILTQPFFLKESDWIPAPPSFHLNIVQGKTYDLDSEQGRQLWNAVQGALQKEGMEELLNVTPEPRYGPPLTIRPRWGQATFRTKVTDTYLRRCAVTGERVLPALEAAHIRPYRDDGPHTMDNGLLLRSDIHKLFDRGLVTITPDYKFQVSDRLRRDYQNGKEYYALVGKDIWVPSAESSKPARSHLEWHNGLFAVRSR